MVAEDILKAGILTKKDEEQENDQLKRRSERILVLLRKMNAKPIIWKCPRYHFPREYDNM